MNDEKTRTPSIDFDKLLGFRNLPVTNHAAEDLRGAMDALHNKIGELPPAPRR